MTAPREPGGDHDYLWDRQGPADPDVARLERALGGLGHGVTRGGLALDALGAQDAAPPAAGRAWRRWALGAGGGAILAAAAAVAIYVGTQPEPPGPPPLACGEAVAEIGFRFAATAGAPRCGGDLVAAGWLPVGGALETGDGDAVRLEVADIGHIELAGGSRLALVSTDATEHRLALDRGKLHARVTAPPRLFVIDTPAVSAVDLGCEYDLEVGPDGASWLRVTSGKVELAGGGRVVLVPMGAEAVTRPGQPPGTPWAIDASPAMRGAIARVDRGGDDAPEALAMVIDLAGARDTVTLWNLLGVVGPQTRGALFDRIVAYVAAPDWVLRADIVAGDAATIDELRAALEDVWFHPELLDDEPAPPTRSPGPARSPEPPLSPEPARSPEPADPADPPATWAVDAGGGSWR